MVRLCLEPERPNSVGAVLATGGVIKGARGAFSIAVLVIPFGIAFGAAAALAQQAKAAEPTVSGNLVMFLTQTDPMVAEHGVHFATRMAESGRAAIIVLVREADTQLLIW